MGNYFSSSSSGNKPDNSIVIDLRKIEKKGHYFKCSSAAGILAVFKTLKE